MSVAERAVNVCDIEDRDGAFVAAVSHVRIEIGGRVHEFDVCQPHLDGLTSAVADFLPAPRRRTAVKRGGRRRAVGARKTTARRPRATVRATGRKSARTPVRSSAAGPSAEQVRMWAREQGLEVRDRGRLPKALIDGYVAAQK